MTIDDALSIENKILQPQQAWRDFLEKEGMKLEQRSLRLKVDELTWEWQEGDVILAFQLPSGSYATSALRELVLPPGR
jgi:tRNA pseudouridine13 synthase